MINQSQLRWFKFAQSDVKRSQSCQPNFKKLNAPTQWTLDDPCDHLRSQEVWCLETLKPHKWKGSTTESFHGKINVGPPTLQEPYPRGLPFVAAPQAPKWPGTVWRLARTCDQSPSLVWNGREAQLCNINPIISHPPFILNTYVFLAFTKPGFLGGVSY
jgi:hypothetical protein